MPLSLLVPLDRSPFAEHALPLALSIARRAKGRLDLVEVHALYALGDATAGRIPFEPARDVECKQQEQLYLDATAKWVSSVSPVSITTGILPGSAVLPETVADSIVERARRGQADLIVMATHCRGLLDRLGHGSVAHDLVRRAPVPVLLTPPSEDTPPFIPEPVFENILIPLDGSTLAEQVLEPALGLACLMEARCSLVRVVEPRSSAAEPPEKTEAAHYLERVAGRLREQGLQVQTRVLVARHAADAILEEAAMGGRDSCRATLIALATHGRGGFKRLLLGSVADTIIRAAASAVLVCHPIGKGP